MKRTIVTYALLPKKLTTGQWIWFSCYTAHQEYKQVYVCTRDLGYPDEGEFGWEDKWVTVSTEPYTYSEYDKPCVK